jgi:YihY family inner membrane protein
MVALALTDRIMKRTKRLLRFFWRVLRAFSGNKGFLLAAAVGYNALLSAIPMLAFFLTVSSYFIAPNVIIDAASEQLSVTFPGQSAPLIAAVTSFYDHRDVISIVGFFVLLVFGTMAFRVLEQAMGVIFHVPERTNERPFLVSTVISFAYIAALGVALISLTIATSVINALAKSGEGIPWLDPASTAISANAPAIVNFIGVTVLFTSFYRVMPPVAVSFRVALAGGFVAGVLWEAVRMLLVWYFANLSLVNVVYGSLSTVVIILLEAEIASIIVLLGAQVIAEIQRSWEAGLPWYREPA